MTRPRIGPEPEPLPRSTGQKLLELLPFGIGKRDKPRHFTDMLRIAWENKGSLGYAMRILNHGVCDGCSLGPYGLKDNVIEGVHLCTTRLRLLRLNTMGPLDTAKLADVAPLKKLKNEALQQLGRLPAPMIRRRGDAGFKVVTWNEALDLLAERLRRTDPLRTA